MDSLRRSGTLDVSADGQYYCGRHYGEKVYPRCSGCDELIFAKEYTFAEEKSWHICKQGRQTYCIDCYMDKFARMCLACKNKIAPFDSRVSHKEFHWHANAACFKCKNCSMSLANQKFLLKMSMCSVAQTAKHNFSPVVPPEENLGPLILLYIIAYKLNV
uniref:LIM zinc-binding domain-containing protein n=2 Tax=Ditylenchus dipsaci TaxID=166011 RepID=A0A915DNG5_9BILA